MPADDMVLKSEASVLRSAEDQNPDLTNEQLTPGAKLGWSPFQIDHVQAVASPLQEEPRSHYSLLA